MKKLRIVFLFVHLAGCSSIQTDFPVVTQSNIQTSTPVLVQTAAHPTQTLSPTATFTPTVTATAIGGGAGKIAFASARDGVSDIYVINPDGSNLIKLDAQRIENEATLERLGAIIQRVLDGQLLDDRILGLGYLAGLDWRQIDLLITYRNYFVQVFSGFGTTTTDDALLKHPQCASLLVEYFETKFSTTRKETAHERADKLLPVLAYKYEELLQKVTVIQEDLILRYFIDLFEATRRTNYYRPGRGDTISIKIESALVEHMPRPCPLYEIYVHAPGVEGIHLRGGKVARGGIRWSDRC